MVSPSSNASDYLNRTSFLKNASLYTECHKQSIILTHLIPTAINSANDIMVENLISHFINVLLTAHFAHEKE